jgi:YidC/Oxa1 family membrane protein insertase
LPFILHFVLLINILNVIRNIIEVGVEGFNQVAYGFVSQFPAGSSVNTSFLGFIDLTKSAGTLGYDDIGRVLPYIILAVLVGVTQYLSTQIMMGIRKKKGEATGRKSEPSKDRKQGEPEDFGQIFQQSTKQTMAILPILIVFMSLNFPAGLSLYWTVQSAFVIIQQLIVDRLKRNG